MSTRTAEYVNQIIIRLVFTQQISMLLHIFPNTGDLYTLYIVKGNIQQTHHSSVTVTEKLCSFNWVGFGRTKIVDKKQFRVITVLI